MDFAVARRQMVEDQLARRGVRHQRVLEAMGRVPRHEFVEAGLASQAYEDRPLTIGFRQTISQPFMVGAMSEALELRPTDRVLEIGTGSGYQTAILCELAAKVYSIERITDLSNRARKALYRLGYMNFELRIGDGTLGWPEVAPFDAILVTAGTPSIPETYLKQLADSGRLVLPVGEEGEQELVRVRKSKGAEPHHGDFQREDLGGCRFVKLVGRYGWQEESG